MRLVTGEGKRIRTGHLEFRWIASPSCHPRVGFIVPKYGRSGVERNRLKRRLREAVRREALGALPAVDVVIRAAPAAYRLRWPVLLDEVVRGTVQLRENP